MDAEKKKNAARGRELYTGKMAYRLQFDRARLLQTARLIEYSFGRSLPVQLFTRFLINNLRSEFL